MDVKATPHVCSTVNSYSPQYKKQFEKLILQLSHQESFQSVQCHKLTNDRFVFKCGELRGIGRISKTSIILELIFLRADLPRISKDITQQLVQTHEVRQIKRNGQTFLENPPRKLKKPQLKPGWREALKELFSDKKELLKYILPFILKEGVKGFISLFNFLAR